MSSSGDSHPDERGELVRRLLTIAATTDDGLVTSVHGAEDGLWVDLYVSASDHTLRLTWSAPSSLSLPESLFHDWTELDGSHGLDRDWLVREVSNELDVVLGVCGDEISDAIEQSGMGADSTRSLWVTLQELPTNELQRVLRVAIASVEDAQGGREELEEVAAQISASVEVEDFEELSDDEFAKALARAVMETSKVLASGSDDELEALALQLTNGSRGSRSVWRAKDPSSAAKWLSDQDPRQIKSLLADCEPWEKELARSIGID
jgi:hypothetical protein